MRTNAFRIVAIAWHVTSKVSTGASKSVYQARPRTVAFPKKQADEGVHAHEPVQDRRRDRLIWGLVFSA